jgi:branched-chain amino acid transport system substrate-binding protein
MRLHHRSVRVVCVMLLALVALSGCRATDETSSNGEATQGVDDDSIKIGLFAPLTGSAAIFGKGQHMAEAIYRDANERGGINGRKLDLQIEDDKCDPTAVNLILRKLISDDKVFMIHGGICSDALMAGLPQATRSKIPLLVQAAATSKTTDPPARNVFVAAPVQADMGAGVADFVKSFADGEGKKRIGILAETTEWGQGWLDPFEVRLEEIGGLEVVARESISEDTGDATAQVRKLRAAKPDIIVAFAFPQPLSVFLRDAHQQGLRVPVVTGNTAQPDTAVQQIGSRAPAELLFGEYCYGKPIAELDHYRQLLKRYYPKDQFDTNAMLSAAGAELTLDVLERMGDDLTWENWVKTMEATQDFQTEASPVPIGYKPFAEGDPTTRRGAVRCNFSHLKPGGEGIDTVVVKDWPDWKRISGAG